jgi:hypothetical protein
MLNQVDQQEKRRYNRTPISKSKYLKTEQLQPVAMMLNCDGAWFDFRMGTRLSWDRLCGLVVRVPGWRPRGPGFEELQFMVHRAASCRFPVWHTFQSKDEGDVFFLIAGSHSNDPKENSVAFSPQANYTDRTTASGRRILVLNLRIGRCHVVSAAEPLRPLISVLSATVSLK